MPDLVLWNASIIDARQAAPREHMCVAIRGEQIAAVRPVDGDRAPRDAIDVGGCYVIPGLIDAHFHLGDDPAMVGDLAVPPAMRGEAPRARELVYFVLANAARAILRSGITTIRDVGCYDDNAIILREAIRLGLTEGPDILACGRIISATAPGAVLFKSMYEEADGPDQMRRCVRNQLKRGADYIKVMAGGARSVLREDPEPAQLTADEMNALVDEAHRLGLRVAAHAEGLGAVRLAVESGVDTIEHGLSLHRAPELLEHMARHGTVLVPTLTTFHDVADRIADRFEPRLVEQAKRQREEAYSTLTAARAAGVTIAMGFDSGPPGANAHELVRMVEGGMSGHEALCAGTAGSALALGLSDRGTVEEGCRADLAVLSVNPLDDVAALTRAASFRMVVKAGRVTAGEPVHA
jgi:imidazolonepropionase-like amidohydrolase